MVNRPRAPPAHAADRPAMDATGRQDPGYLNQLEPPALVESFLAHPPIGFEAGVSRCGAPFFVAEFDLLTTADTSLRRTFERLRLRRLCGRLLRPRTTFVGTTVSEYALLPRGVPPVELLDSLLEEHACAHPFLILKDLPADSPLLEAASNRLAEELVAGCRERGLAILEGQALAYVPIDFGSSEEYVARLSSGRRKDIRRKLRRREDLEIECRSTGDPWFAEPKVVDECYRLYRNVYDQSEIHFDCLSKEFFEAVLTDPRAKGLMVLYRHGGVTIGFNLLFVRGRTLVDKYIGFAYPMARQKNLYFVSWVRNLELALERGLSCYVAGWTDPEIKRHLGARFTFTRHAVYARNPLVRRALRLVAGRFESDRSWYDQRAREASSHP
jgi:Peptidogalycan biosysnthesis/recognition